MLRCGIALQGNKIGKIFGNIIVLDTLQLGFRIGYSPAMFSSRIYLSNVLILGESQLSNDINIILKQGIQQQGLKFGDILAL